MEKTTFTVLSCILKPTRASALKLKEGGCAKELATNATDDFMNSTTTAARIAILFAIAIMFHTAVLAQGNNYEGPVGVTGIFNGNVTTGCSYDPLTQSAHRVIDDIVVPGSIGKYPLKMTRYYNSRQQYYGGPAIGLSPGWAHEYSWLLWSAGHRVVSPHGNVSDDYCGPPVGVSESLGRFAFKYGRYLAAGGRW